MKQLFLSAFFVFIVTALSAQKDTIRLRGMEKERKEIVTDREPQVIYFQFGGSAPIISVNYDRRFSKKVNGAGFTAGLGFWGASGVSIFSIPASVNYLFGKTSSFIEVAAGATFITATTLDLFEEDTRESGSTVFYHFNLGYRYQPIRGGFFFRGGISPLVVPGGYFTSYYIGFGHNF